MTTLPPNYLRLSSTWLETNPLPEDARYYNVLFKSWESTQWAGYLLDHVVNQGYTYATARTDLPREAYADEIRPMTHEERKALDEFTTKELTESEPTPDLTQPGLPKADLTQPEVASERAEEYIEPKTVREAQIHCQLKVEVNTLRAQLEAKEGECRRLRENLDSDERSLGHWDAWLSSVLDDESDEAPWNIAAALFTRLTAELDALKSIFDTELEAHKRNCELLRQRTADLDAVRKERADLYQTANAYSGLMMNCADTLRSRGIDASVGPLDIRVIKLAKRADAAQARCGELELALRDLDTALAVMFWTSDDGMIQKLGEPDDAPDEKLGKAWAEARALLTPSQQPDKPIIALPPGHYPDSLENPIEFGEGPPEPVKAGEWLPFDLAKALSGARVITRAGRLATDITKEKAGQWKIRGIVDGMPRRWNEQGRYYSCETDSRFDLFIAPPIAPEGKATEGEG